MDEVDRMFRRLLQNVRAGYAQYLSHPFEVAELYQTLIPYRHNRREMALETNQDYEMALCRLLAGERNYLVVDDALAEAMRSELAASNPNTAIFREFAAARIAIAPGTLRLLDELGPPETSVAGTGADAAASPAVPPSRSAPPPAAAPAAARTRDDGVESCRYCGGFLPLGRSSNFCPHCGQNLTIQRCPACGTELDISWRFCITCGRGVAAT
jgi:predicted RNA-binding Zn-ribbon protein involved in translation (DUF1610 family)